MCQRYDHLLLTWVCRPKYSKLSAMAAPLSTDPTHCGREPVMTERRSSQQPHQAQLRLPTPGQGRPDCGLSLLGSLSRVLPVPGSHLIGFPLSQLLQSVFSWAPRIKTVTHNWYHGFFKESQCNVVIKSHFLPTCQPRAPHKRAWKPWRTMLLWTPGWEDAALDQEAKTSSSHCQDPHPTSSSVLLSFMTLYEKKFF